MGLLKGIDPLLTADVLHVLRAAGHGDRICICDCNFPAATVATYTTTKKHIVLPNSELTDTVKAIISVLPVDHFTSEKAVFMVPDEGKLPEIAREMHKDVKQKIFSMNLADANYLDCERTSFYKRAKNCFAVIQTAERRPYGNVIISKGCIGPDGKELRPEFAN